MQMTKSVHLSKKPPTTTAAPVRTSSPNSTASATDKSKKKKKPGPISKAEGDAEEAYAEDDAHHETASAAGNTAPCTAPVPPAALAKRKKKKKAKSKASVSSQGISELDEDSQALMQSSTPNSGSHWLVDTRNSAVANSKKDDEFWSSMSNSEERQKIREFWLGLGEEERRSLVKVEKDAVLRKMKEQQKNSCNCSVCGKKRTAIEDELEVLYDAYYEELEQYANHQQQTRFYSTADGALTGNNYEGGSPVSYEEGYDGQLDEDDDEEDDDDYSHAYDDDINSQSDQSDNLSEGEKSSYDEPSFPDRLSQNTAAGVDHFNFGNSLTVKGGILTVADDLLKNDGKKFLDMMERLAERRIQKEDEVMEQTDDYYDEIDEDDDEAYDEEEEEAGTDEQRMEEGRRMFQIFAARMFEQRVLAAYREKVARERQQRLIQELEEEDRLRQERELKKQKEKERKKDRKRQLKKQKEEERLAREAQRKAEEEAARAERERKLEEERRKREQERLKKEEERRQKEEERLRKEEEKRRRLKEERERAAEKERKRKEKEEQERREREGKERKEREERERKEREERERKEREERERKEREEKARAAKRKAEEEQRRAKEKEEQGRAEREKREAEAAAATTATKSDKSAKPIESSPAPQSTTASSVASPAVSSSSPMRPVDDAARQKALMDVLVGSSTQASAARASSDVNPPNLDMSVPPHPLLPLNGLPHSLPIGPARLAGQTATSPTHPFAAIDRGVMPIGFGRLSSSFDAGSSSSSAAKVISRPGSHIAPIGQPPNGRRPSSNAGPIGSPVGSRANRVSSADESGSSSAIGSGKRPLMSADRSETTNSFFSNFLFGEPSRDAYQDQGMRSSRSRLDKTVERRFSLESSNLGWTNGWTASTALSDNVHGRLFGDVLADRSTTILERAKAAYAKLDEITQTKYYNPARFHSLAQLHRMMCDMYYDLQVDIRELYEVISSPFSGFECINNAHSGWLVRYEGLRGVGSPALGSISSSPSIVQPPSVPHLPSSPPGPLFANSMPPPPQMKGNTQLFGSMS